MHLLLPTLALAAGLDADGDGLPAADGAGGVGLVPTAPREEAGGAATLRSEAVGGALVRQEPSGASTSLIGSGTIVRAQLATSWLPWLGTTATLPFRLGASSEVGAGAPSLGDLRATLWAGAGAGTPRQLSLGVGTSVPSGSPSRYAGAGRLVPHGRLAGRLDAPVGGSRLEVLASGWLAHEGAIDEVDAVGGAQVGGAARGGCYVGPANLGLSLRALSPLDAAIRARRGAAVELAVDGGLQASERIGLSLLVARGIVGGVGAPDVRAALGVSYRWAPEPEPVLEVAQPRSLRVVDPDGTPVAGATVTLDDESERSAGVDGRIEIPGDASGMVRAKGLRTTPVPAPGASDRLVLDWAPVPLHVQIAAVDGSAITPEVTLTGPATVPVDDPRAFRGELVPGVWILEATAPGYGRQRRSVEVLPRGTEPIDIEVVLLPDAGTASLDLTVSDPQGNGVSGAELRIDGVSIGTAGRGTVGIEGLAATEVEVEVARKSFRVQQALVDLSAGEGEAEIALYYAPGTVRVTARGPTGPIADGMLLVDGPRALPPLVLGDGGESLLHLGDGEWTLALTSPAHGMQERLVDIRPDSPVPVEAAFVLLGEVPEEPGPVSLWVDVLDLDGTPVTGVEIRIDGRTVGTTATGGSLRLEGLHEGPATVSVHGAAFATASRADVLQAGLEVITLPILWNPGTIEVSARDPEGPADALVAFSGPGAYEGGALGSPGRRTFLDLPSGDWEVLASHTSGMQVAWATSHPDPGRRTSVDFRLGERTGDGVLSVTATAPDGLPVEGAELWFGERPLVRTGGGGSVKVSGLPTGPVDLVLRHPNHQPVIHTLDVTVEATPWDVEMPWAAGVVDLVVDSSAPLEAAIAYLSGPHPMDPVPIALAGRPQRLALGPGRWEVMVTATTGLAQASIELPDEPVAPTLLRLQVGPPAGALVHVVDHRQHPLAGIPLHRDGKQVAVTDAAGTALVPLPDGVSGPDAPVGAVTPIHPAYHPVAPAVLTADDEHWFELEAFSRDVTVAVRHGGAGVAATLSAHGPGRIAPVPIDGSGTIALPPGEWELVVDPEEGLGAQRRSVVVPLEGKAPSVAFDLVAARVRATETGLELIDVHFGRDEDVAGAKYATLLEEVAASITGDPRIRRVEVQGHSDPTGEQVYNYDLSRRRAESIVAALAALGVPPELLEARGYGPSRPIADNATPQGQALNRRVDFRTILIDGEDSRAGR